MPRAASSRSKGASGSSASDMEVSWNNVTLTAAQKVIWKKLATKRRKPVATKFLDVPTLQEFGFEQPVRFCMEKAGMGGFVGKADYTYFKWTLEFLSTLVVDDEESDAAIYSFQVNNHRYKIGKDKLRAAFGWDGNPSAEYYVADKYSTFWWNLTHRPASNEMNIDICHPALRFGHRVIAQCVFGLAEPTKVTYQDLRYLYCMAPEADARPDWAYLFIENCLRIRNSEIASIGLGGMITLLAKHLGEVPSPDLVFAKGSNVINATLMKKTHWISPDPYAPDVIYWNITTSHSRHFIIPQPDLVALSSTTKDRDLYLPGQTGVVPPRVGSGRPVRTPRPMEVDGETAEEIAVAHIDEAAEGDDDLLPDDSDDADYEESEDDVTMEVGDGGASSSGYGSTLEAMQRWQLSVDDEFDVLHDSNTIQLAYLQSIASYCKSGNYTEPAIDPDVQKRYDGSIGSRDARRAERAALRAQGFQHPGSSVGS